MEVDDRLLAVLAPDVGRDVVHRPGAVERHHGRQVEDRRRLQLPDVAAHARGLELEHARRLARGQQLERLRVVERDVVQVHLHPAVVADQVHGLAQDREVGQAQEVELEQAQRLDAVHLVLGHQGVGVGRLLERHELGQRFPRDDHAGRVGGRVAGDPLELLREPDQLADLGVAVVHLLELRAELQRLREPDAQLVGHRLGDPVHVPVAHAHHPAHVADRRAGEHRAEGDDLGDMVRAVLAADVVDDLVPALVLEVHVDVGHRHAVRVEEALEGEPVVERVHRRDPQGVGDDGAGRGPPAGRRDPLLPGEADEVGHDQEVARVAHREDHAQLVVEARLELGGDRAVAADEAGLALLAQPALDGLAVGHREMRDPQLAQGQLEVHHLGDAPGVEQRLALVREEAVHLGRGLEVEVRALEAHPVLRVEVAPGAHAQQDVVRLVLRLVHVVQVVGDDQRQAGLRGEPEELLVEPLLLRDPVVLQLQEEPVLAQDVPVLARELAGQLPVVHLEGLGDLPAEACGHADQALAVPGQVLPVDAGLVVVAVDVGVGDQPAQVLVAGHVGRQEHEVEGLAVGLALLVRHRPPGDVGLHADDGLDARLGGRLVERHRPVERAVVGDGEAVEAVLDRRVDEVGDPPQPVEQAELRVGVEVDEVVRGDGHGTSMVARRDASGRPAKELAGAQRQLERSHS